MVTLDPTAEPMLTTPDIVCDVLVRAHPVGTSIDPEFIVKPNAGIVHVFVEAHKALKQSAAKTG